MNDTTKISMSREAERFIESLGSSEIVPFGHYGMLRKFGSSGHVCIRSDFPGSSSDWTIIRAGEVEALAVLLSDISKHWAKLKDQVAVDESKDKANGRSRK